MVRAGVVQHPVDWDVGGYREIQLPPRRYAIIDLPALAALSGLDGKGIPVILFVCFGETQ